MDVGPINSAVSAAGAPLAQSNGPEADRAQRESAVQQRGVQYDAIADQAAGIGQTDGEEHTTQERYGDGRQPWEMAASDDAATDKNENSGDVPPAPRDPAGPNGRLIDLSG